MIAERGILSVVTCGTEGAEIHRNDGMVSLSVAELRWLMLCAIPAVLADMQNTDRTGE